MYDESLFGCSDVDRVVSLLAGALRAVVELHAPNEHGNCGTCTKAAQRAGNHVRWRVSHPCPTVQAIARELGIEAGEGRG